MTPPSPTAGAAPRRPIAERLVLLAATGFGLGYSPFASGTCGAILGLPLALGLTRLHAHVWLQAAIALAFTILAVPICDAAERIFGNKDDGRIVADEYMLLPICFVGQGPVWDNLLAGGVTTLGALVFIGFAFVVSRLVDILKPTPCRQLQNVRGGMGIVLDDFFADLYSWVIVWGLSDVVVNRVVALFA